MNPICAWPELGVSPGPQEWYAENAASPAAWAWGGEGKNVETDGKRERDSGMTKYCRWKHEFIHATGCQSSGPIWIWMPLRLVKNATCGPIVSLQGHPVNIVLRYLALSFRALKGENEYANAETKVIHSCQTYKTPAKICSLQVDASISEMVKKTRTRIQGWNFDEGQHDVRPCTATGTVARALDKCSWMSKMLGKKKIIPPQCWPSHHLGAYGSCMIFW